MKALLLKDIKVLSVHMKLYGVMILAYTLLGAAVQELAGFQLFPILFCAMFPVNALSFDERCHWFPYGVTLPCSRKDLVVSKYILGLASMFSAALLCLSAALFLSPVFTDSAPDIRAFSGSVLLAVAAGMIFMDMILPLSFHMGTEKSRMAYLLCIILSCSTPAILTKLGRSSDWFHSIEIPFEPAQNIIFFAALATFLTILSAIVSVRILSKKDLA